MDPPIDIDDFKAMGPEALQSGLFPNGYRPEDDVPVPGTRNPPVPTTRRTGNPPSSSSGRDTNFGLQSNEQAVPSFPRRSGDTHVNAPVGENTKTIPTNSLTTNSLTTDFTHQSSNSARNTSSNKRQKSTRELGSGLSEDTNHNSDNAETTIHESSGSELPRKRGRRNNNDNPQQSIPQISNTGTIPSQRRIRRTPNSEAPVNITAGSITAANPVATNGTATLGTIAPGKPARRKIAPRKAATAKPKRVKVRKVNAKYGSGQHPHSDLFATREYRDSKALAPRNPPFKLSKQAEESRMSSGSPPEDSSDPVEIGDLVHIINTLSPHTGQGYFKTLQDIDAIDRMITIGLKISSKDEDEGDDDHAEAPKAKPKARGTGATMLTYTGLDTNLPPLSNIDDIFADLTQRALDVGLSNFLEAIGSRPIKIATLCSGTESPLLALQMVQESEYMGS